MYCNCNNPLRHASRRLSRFSLSLKSMHFIRSGQFNKSFKVKGPLLTCEFMAASAPSMPSDFCPTRGRFEGGSLLREERPTSIISLWEATTTKVQADVLWNAQLNALSKNDMVAIRRDMCIMYSIMISPTMMTSCSLRKGL